jgi:hypothetical protein
VTPANGLVAQLQGRVKGLQVIGDAAKPGKVHDAIAAGYALGRQL